MQLFSYVTFSPVQNEWSIPARYGSLGMHEEAVEMYAIRANMTNTWEEETFMAMFRGAEHAYWAGFPWPDVRESVI